MNKIRIKDIYAGMPDAKDEFITDQGDSFFASFVVPPGLEIADILCGKKFLICGDKGVGKTSVLYYLQKKAQENDVNTCTSFMYFKSEFGEKKKSNMETIEKKMTAVVDISGEIQAEKVEYLDIWRWVFYKKIVDDCEENQNGLFEQDDNWREFEKLVNKISFSSESKKVISLSSLSLSVSASTKKGLSGEAKVEFEKVARSSSAFSQLIEIVEKCDKSFEKLKRTDIPYYIFVDEMEAYFGNKEIFKRDLTLIRDLIFTIYRINSVGKIKIIAALRNEVLYSIGKFIQPREINKITDGYGFLLKWSYSNTTSYDHPIIKILMKRISITCGTEQSFINWFPEKIGKRYTVSYILDNGWNKPRDIVRLIRAAQNDSIHCNDSFFSQAVFDTLRKEYSRNSLSEVKEELQSLYTIEEIEMLLRLIRGGNKVITPEILRKKSENDVATKKLWYDRENDILEDFYRVGIWGNKTRNGKRWRWNHKGDTGVLKGDGWELVIHPALWSELSIIY